MTDPSSLPNFPPPPDEHPVRGRVLDALVDLGVAPNIDADGDVAFTVNDQQLFVRCSEGEVQIMRVFGQWQIQDDLLADRVKLYETCNELNLNLNCVKSGVAGTTLVVTGEHVITPGSDLTHLVQVSIQVILSGVHIWHQRVRGIDPSTGEPDGGVVVTDLVRLEVEDGIGTIRLNRPPMNALNAEIQHGLVAACREAGQRKDVAAVVVYGGEKVFAAGADIKEMEAMSYTDMVDHSALLQDFTRALASLPKPTVAAITGYALGGGCEVALACDFRVVAQDAKPGQPEVLLGIIPGAGGTQRLARLVGPARAKDLVFSGRLVDADEALAIGLADEVVPAADVYTAAKARVARYVGGPGYAVRAAKEAIDRGLEVDLESGLEIERMLFAGTFATKDRAIGMRHFVDKGKGPAPFEGA